MGILDVFRREQSSDQVLESLETQVAGGNLTIEMLTEKLGELELALEDQGWIRLGLEGELDFSLEGIRSIIRLSRIMAIKNPLIKNGVAVQQNYVFGQGLQIKATNSTVDAAVQAFLDKPANKKILTSHKARTERERDLQVEGNIFFAPFVNLSTGETVLRTLPTLEIADIICNPEDLDEPWWYKRVWIQRVFDGKGYQQFQRTAYYRDWEIPEQAAGVTNINGVPVMADVWVYHLKVGALRGMKFGVPETYASLDWARAYKDWLANWSSLQKSLAKLAWRLRGKSKQVRKAMKALATTLDVGEDETNPPPVTGGIAGVPAGMELDAIPKSGAHVAADDGTQLRKMAAAGMGIADNIMSSDPQQGTMATAKTLDRPSELSFKGRQMLWADVFRDLIGFALRKAASAPNGMLREATSENKPLKLDLEVDFPDLLERDARDAVRAVVDAATLSGRPAAGVLPPELVTKLLLIALSVEDVDEALKGFDPSEIPPEVKPAVEAALKEFRQVMTTELERARELTAS